MKHLVPAFLVVAILLALFMTGCSSYDGGGSNFSQQDLELQRKLAERQLGR